MADELSDPRPRESLSVEKGDATVTEIVRGKRRDPPRRCRPRDRGPEAVGSEALEDGTIGYAIVPRAERDDRGENVRRRRNPARRSRLLVRDRAA